MGSFITIQLYFYWRIKRNYVLLYTNIYSAMLQAAMIAEEPTKRPWEEWLLSDNKQAGTS